MRPIAIQLSYCQMANSQLLQLEILAELQSINQSINPYLPWVNSTIYHIGLLRKAITILA